MYKRLEAIITGRVQGVGFRYFVEMKANELEIFGWVEGCGRRQRG